MDIDAANQELRELHQKLFTRDRLIAALAVLEKYLPLLKSRVEEIANYRRYIVRDKHAISDAATDVLYKFVEEPESYDPARSANVFAYLAHAAVCDLANHLAKEATRKKYEKAVEQPPASRNTGDANEYDDVRWELIAKFFPGDTVQQFAEKFFADPTDQQLCLLMMEGTRGDDGFAEILGVDGPPETVRREIKRHKDRIAKQLRRFGEEISQHGD